MNFKTLFSVGLAALLFVACDDKTNSNTDKPNSDTIVTKKEPKLEEPTKVDKIDKIAVADALMQKIDATKADHRIEERSFINYEMNMAHDQSNYTVAYRGEEMVKLTEFTGESMYSFESTYYHQDGKIFLIHSKGYYDGMQFDETKIYLEEGKPFAVVEKAKKEDDTNTNLVALKMEKKELSAVIQNMDGYMKYLAEIPKRLAASKIHK